MPEPAPRKNSLYPSDLIGLIKFLQALKLLNEDWAADGIALELGYAQRSGLEKNFQKYTRLYLNHEMTIAQYLKFINIKSLHI